MREKRKDCKYCGKEIEAKTTRKEFCSDLHRVYWNREHPQTTVKVLKEVAKRMGAELVAVESKHPKFDPKDPKEGSAGFYLKYGVFKYDDIT